MDRDKRIKTLERSMDKLAEASAEMYAEYTALLEADKPKPVLSAYQRALQEAFDTQLDAYILRSN